MSENGDIYTAGKNFTLPPAVTAWTNSTSVQLKCVLVTPVTVKCPNISSHVFTSWATQLLCCATAAAEKGPDCV